MIRSFLNMIFGGLLALQAPGPAERPRPPVIDMHVHSTNTAPQDVLERMKSLNIRYIYLAGLAPDLPAWTAALTLDRHLPSLGFPCPGGRAPFVDRPCWDNSGAFPDTNWLRDELRAGRIKGFGELVPQLLGISPDDKRFEPYWQLAEEFDVPVAIHMGPGPPAAAYESSPSPVKFPEFRMAANDPLILEDILLRHKRLRLLLMHAGWPFLDSTLALLYAHPNVYVDVGALQSEFMVPRASYYRHLRSLVEGGFARRIVFGSDFPNQVGPGIDAILAAEFLSPQQKTDILCDNAARFLRLDASVCRPNAGAELLRTIRDGDARQVEALLRGGSNPNTKDETGATALMYAAAFASPEVMIRLLDDGADVNSTNQSGANALMWATHDAAKVRLLLDRGAGVNVRGPDGTTALISAALRGKTDVMKMLIDAGANVREGTALAPWPMGLQEIASTTNDAAMREFLKLKDVTTLTPPPLTQWILTMVFSWRPQPASTSAELVKALLDRGASPNEIVSQLTLTVPALSRVVRTGDPEAARLLLQRGADPNLKGSRGLTPLMMAAAADQNPATVKLLIEKGAKVDARDEAGRTALDWALLQGESEVSRTLQRAGAVQAARPGPAPAPVSKPRPPQVAIELALSRLQPAGPGFHQKAPCISCHNQSLPAVAVKHAGDKGIKVDRELSKHPTEATLKVWNQNREKLMMGNCGVFGFVGNVTYGMFGMAEEGVVPNAVTDAVASCLSGLQKPDGSWEGSDVRPPLSGQIPIVYTALAVRGLKMYSPPGRREETTARLARARDFLRKATPADTQDAAFKLLGLVWSQASASEIADQAKRLLALQRENGGWGQWPGMSPDAYATGQSLYALSASGMTASNSQYRRGTQYLLRTQLEDGTWYVRSRTIGFQPYVDSGFPHGTDQFISAAATSWAVIALAQIL